MDSYTTSRYPSSRVATFDVGSIGRKKHHVQALVEIDVTEARRKIKELLKAGRDIGFTPWLLKAIAAAIEAHPEVHAMNYRGRRQILFDDVDISIPVEKTVEGAKVPLVTVIRAANRKSIDEIYLELQAAKGKKVESAGDYVLSSDRPKRLQSLFFELPRGLRLLVWKALLKDPFTRKRNMGSVMVTAMGISGKNPGWIVPKSLHNLSFGIGTIMKKPWVRHGGIAIREILHLTVLFDHDVVDGAPAARFTDALIRGIEGGVGL